MPSSRSTSATSASRRRAAARSPRPAKSQARVRSRVDHDVAIGLSPAASARLNASAPASVFPRISWPWATPTQAHTNAACCPAASASAVAASKWSTEARPNPRSRSISPSTTSNHTWAARASRCWADSRAASINVARVAIEAGVGQGVGFVQQVGRHARVVRAIREGLVGPEHRGAPPPSPPRSARRSGTRYCAPRPTRCESDCPTNPPSPVRRCRRARRAPLEGDRCSRAEAPAELAPQPDAPARRGGASASLTASSAPSRSPRANRLIDSRRAKMNAIVLRQRRVVPHRGDGLLDRIGIGGEPGRFDRDRGRGRLSRHDRPPRSRTGREFGVATDEREAAGAQEHVRVDFAAHFEPPQRQTGDVLAPSRAVAIELIGQLRVEWRGSAAPSSGSG